jgi:hypothetical protein
MRLLLQAAGDPAEEATHAVVEIDADEILQRRELLQMVLSKDKGLVKICFWCAVDFYGVDLEDVSQELSDEFEGECDQWVILPKEVDTTTKEWNHVRTDCDMMVLHDNVVSWQGYCKYGPGTLTTSSLSYEQVIELGGDER